MATGTDFGSKQPLIDSVQDLVKTNTDKSTTSDKIQEAILSTIETLYNRINVITGGDPISIANATQALGVSLVNSVLAITQASGSTSGLLSQADWNTFNSKLSSESITSLQLSGNQLTYADENGTLTVLDLPSFTETLTSLNVVNGELVYTDEAGNSNNIPISSSETTTSLSITNNVISYVDEEGNTTTIDLSLYLDDTNLSRLTSAVADNTTGVVTFTRDDNSTFTLDLSFLMDIAAVNQLQTQLDNYIASNDLVVQELQPKAPVEITHSTAGEVLIDCSQGEVFFVTATADIANLNYSNEEAGKQVIVHILHDGNISFTLEPSKYKTQDKNTLNLTPSQAFPAGETEVEDIFTIAFSEFNNTTLGNILGSQSMYAL